MTNSYKIRFGKTPSTMLGPCHNRMGYPRVADGGDVLQIWTVAASILNRQSRTADKRWTSSFGVGWGAFNFSS